MRAVFAVLVVLGCLATVLSAPAPARRPAVKYGRSDGKKDVLAPKVMIVTMFSPETNVWLASKYKLTAINVTVLGFSSRFPAVGCNAAGSVCVMTTDEGEINAASTLSALTFSPFFNLKKTYFFITGIAGINPKLGSIGSVTFARYAIQVDLFHEFDARELPKDWPNGFVALGARYPNEYPGKFYGTEVYELNEALLDKLFTVASKAKLQDSPTARGYRANYKTRPAIQPPMFVKCDTATSDIYWGGTPLAETFDNFTRVVTNGTGRYCTTQQEDNGTLGALLRAAMAGLVDFGRIIIMRTASDFDRPQPGGNSVDLYLHKHHSGGYELSIANLVNAGGPVVDEITKNWDKVYANGIKAKNFLGDVWNDLSSEVKATWGPSAPESKLRRKRALAVKFARK
ncbi:uncharacterized protein LOC129595377 [Paramacrobiotus metropolitanus]|uniref:uncharacterized protein LOC129595377 n=1 Tax=Paramacrobiotus metropolitanus TaxID=2943436 RepID=UPI002445650C|nr:uncharacterized protein LOC129595377 [Paramacrobiotus metropolitanus]